MLLSSVALVRSVQQLLQQMHTSVDTLSRTELLYYILNILQMAHTAEMEAPYRINSMGTLSMSANNGIREMGFDSSDLSDPSKNDYYFLHYMSILFILQLPCTTEDVRLVQDKQHKQMCQVWK